MLSVSLVGRFTSRVGTSLTGSGSAFLSQIFGCDIVVSNRLRNANALKEGAYIVKPGALRLVLKRNTLLETDRDILRRVNVFTATKHYVTYRYNESGMIKLKVKQQ